MQIGIIGSGNIGGNLTRRLAALGHDVRVANSRGPQSLQDLAAETGATPVVVDEVARGADLVVVAVPEKNVGDLPEGVLDSRAPGAPVVDTGNYYPRQRDGRIEAIEAGLTESEWVANQLGAPVVKAFNGIRAQLILDVAALPAGAPRPGVAVAGDDPEAKATVFRLVEELGFEAVDAGRLEDSWRQQPGTPWYVAGLDADGVRKALVDASPERLPEFRG